MKKPGNMLFWIVVIVVVLFAAYTFYNKNNPSKVVQQPPQNSTSEADTETNKERPTPPEIILKDLNGKTVKLSDYKGKVVILNFWASWCPPCKEEMPELDRASKEFEKGNDAVLLSVDLTDGVRETAEKAKNYISANNFSMIVLLDTEGKAANDYGIQNIPTTFIIDKQGKVYDYIVGPTSKDALVNYVNKLKEESAPQYKSISPADAKERLAADKNIILLDVRTLEEYDDKHIPNSTLIPLDTLEADASKKLSDKSSTIFVYCRSGNRSATASELLLNLGYTDVYDLGGIIDWPYETESGKAK